MDVPEFQRRLNHLGVSRRSSRWTASRPLLCHTPCLSMRPTTPRGSVKAPHPVHEVDFTYTGSYSQ